MDGLKALLAKKKQERQELVGDKKVVRKQEVEEAKLKRIREEEEQERLAKVRAPSADEGGATRIERHAACSIHIACPCVRAGEAAAGQRGGQHERRTPDHCSWQWDHRCVKAAGHGRPACTEPSSCGSSSPAV